jgi:hypothetical protein
MIDAGLVREILAIYTKHGWTLRRVLLSDAEKTAAGPSVREQLGGVPVSASQLDAMWFSRVSKGTLEAWELRHLGPTPYALLEVIDREEGESAREAILAETESRMQNVVTRRN